MHAGEQTNLITTFKELKEEKTTPRSSRDGRGRTSFLKRDFAIVDGVRGTGETI